MADDMAGWWFDFFAMKFCFKPHFLRDCLRNSHFHKQQLCRMTFLICPPKHLVETTSSIMLSPILIACFDPVNCLRPLSSIYCVLVG